MSNEKSGGQKLKEAVETYGSLGKANEVLLGRKKRLEADVVEAEKKLSALKNSQQQSADALEGVHAQIDHSKSELNGLRENLSAAGIQYQLFEGFLGMMGTSPSAKANVDPGHYLRSLAESNWLINTTPEKARDIFIRATMGDYLWCFRCEGCGASFIVNRDPKYPILHQGHNCPSCGFRHQVVPDDSFLKVMLSEDQVNKVLTTKAVQAENEELSPFKQLIGYKCEICKQPITDWTEGSVKFGIEGYGWCHAKCWNSTTGQLKQTLKNVEILQKIKQQNSQAK